MNKPFQRIGSTSNAHVGREFERSVKDFFQSQEMIELQSNIKVPVGIEERTKIHEFDLGNEQRKIIVECKSHKWRKGNSVPSAKLTVWNEAMLYFIAAPDEYRRIMVVLKDYNSKTRETLAQYYLRTYFHFIPKNVEFWEYDEELLSAIQIRK